VQFLIVVCGPVPVLDVAMTQAVRGVVATWLIRSSLHDKKAHDCRRLNAVFASKIWADDVSSHHRVNFVQDLGG